MKRLLALFSVLAVTFAGIWIYKMKNPEERPENINAVNIEGNYWWNAKAQAEPEVSTNWKLSDGVPANYIPVPGRPELYMVVDDDGYITGYKQRSKNDAGEWEWTDVNPDIPENYEPVPGLKDVYRVTEDDGTVHYFKYVRNKDDTYAFVEVDAKGNMLGVDKPKGNEVPENYERVNRNQYAVKDNNGVTITYMERVVNPASETGFDWVQIEEPNTETTVADPLPGFDLNTDITGLGSDTGGTRPFYGDTTASNSGDMSALPTLMPQQVITSSSTSGTFVFKQPVSETTITEQVYVTAPPITGMNFNTQQGNQNTGNSVSTGQGSGDINYPGQSSIQDNTQHTLDPNLGGNTSAGDTGSLPDWQLGDLTGNSGNTQASGTPITITLPDGTVINQTYEDIVNGYEQPSIPTITDGGTGNSQNWEKIPGGKQELSGNINTSNEKTGTVNSVETSIERVQEGNDIVTYQKVEKVVYDLQGNVLTRNVTDKKEISRESKGGQVGNAADINTSNLNAEYDRVTALLSRSNGRFNSGVPNEVVNTLNSDRMASQKNPLTFDGNSAMYKIALCRACMMAFTGTNSRDLQGYGTLGNMCKLYGVPASSPSENMLVTGSLSAAAVHSVFQESSFEARMSDTYSSIVVAIVEYGGKYYVDEIVFR